MKMESPADILKNDIYDLILQIENGMLMLDNFNVSVELERTMHISAELGLVEICEKLINFNCNIDCIDENERTPLMSACQNGNLDVVRLFLRNGSNPDLKDQFGNTPLLLAIESGNLELVEIFLKILNSSNSETLLGLTTPLAVASFFGETKIVEMLLEQFPHMLDIPVEKSGMTPLMLATSAGHTETTQLLLKHGANIETKNSNFQTPIDIASISDVESIKFLFSPAKKTPHIVIPLPQIDASYPNVNLSVSNNAVKHSRHPLTPNLAFPLSNPLSNITRLTRKDNETKDCPNCNTKRRSKSTESQMKIKKRKSETEDILESILNYSNISECMPIFREQEIDFKTFLTLDDEDLKLIGIDNETTRSKVLNAVQHYKRIFFI